jgi:DNA-binding transcriptional LysR family regulator
MEIEVSSYGWRSMNLLSLDIRMLRSLTSVADTGSITETARQLGRTQPAISLQIQRLEEITGKALFRHEGRRMQLTQDGDMVLGYASSSRVYRHRTSRATWW